MCPAKIIKHIGRAEIMNHIGPALQPVDDKPPRTWDEIADGYDGELAWDETLMGLKLCRWWLIRQARVRQHAAQTCWIPFVGTALAIPSHAACRETCWRCQQGQAGTCRTTPGSS